MSGGGPVPGGVGGPVWAQPWAAGWPLGVVRVMHQVVLGWVARAWARVRESVASR